MMSRLRSKWFGYYLLTMAVGAIVLLTFAPRTPKPSSALILTPYEQQEQTQKQRDVEDLLRYYKQ